MQKTRSGQRGNDRTDRENRKRGKHAALAQFTVEAAFLMVIILPILAGVLLAGFYLHDRTFLQGTAVEVSAMGSVLQTDGDAEEKLGKLLKRRLKGSMLWALEASGTAECGEKQVSVSCSGSFHVPEITEVYLGKADGELQKIRERRLYDAADLIWKVRSAKYLIDALLEE